MGNDERLNDIVGSAYYVAPEVLHRSYSLEADIWSIGILFLRYVSLFFYVFDWGSGETVQIIPTSFGGVGETTKAVKDSFHHNYILKWRHQLSIQDEFQSLLSPRDRTSACLSLKTA
uniref:Protein kinase domain-containing protein n=1 Tax=Solanum lycopersicum TaxID=4081 RepID=A0A3Q7G269_SOLLC